MKQYFQTSITAMALSAMVLGSVVATVSTSAAPAFSQGNSASNGNGNANRNENSNRGDRNNNSNRGATASSLGALNAAHANANALENASANSRVGMIAIYKLAVEATAEASAAFDAAELALNTFEADCGVDGDKLTTTVFIEVDGEEVEVPYCGNVMNEAAALDETVDAFDYDSYVAWLNLAKTDAATAKAEAEQLEGEALEAAANKVTNEEVIIALWDLLELPTE